MAVVWQGGEQQGLLANEGDGGDACRCDVTKRVDGGMRGSPARCREAKVTSCRCPTRYRDVAKMREYHRLVVGRAIGMAAGEQEGQGGGSDVTEAGDSRAAGKRGRRQ